MTINIAIGNPLLSQEREREYYSKIIEQDIDYILLRIRLSHFDNILHRTISSHDNGLPS